MALMHTYSLYICESLCLLLITRVSYLDSVAVLSCRGSTALGVHNFGMLLNHIWGADLKRVNARSTIKCLKATLGP